MEIVNNFLCCPAFPVSCPLLTSNQHHRVIIWSASYVSETYGQNRNITPTVIVCIDTQIGFITLFWYVIYDPLLVPVCILRFTTRLTSHVLLSNLRSHVGTWSALCQFSTWTPIKIGTSSLSVFPHVCTQSLYLICGNMWYCSIWAPTCILYIFILHSPVLYLISVQPTCATPHWYPTWACKYSTRCVTPTLVSNLCLQGQHTIYYPNWYPTCTCNNSILFAIPHW